jgi:hypothetical protein
LYYARWSDDAANISFSDKRITNLGDATAEEDAVNLKLLRANEFNYVDAGGTATALTADCTPAVTEYTVGLQLYVVATADSGSGATIALNGLDPKDILSPSPIAAGDWKAGDTLHLIYDGTSFVWINGWRHSDIPPGTVAIFQQASAPAGWTQVTSNNDRILRVVSGAGGGTAGSWTISGLSTASDGAHTHTATTAEDFVHITDNAQDSGGSADLARSTHVHTLTTSSNGAHTHTMVSDASWRPAVVDVIACSRDT